MISPKRDWTNDFEHVVTIQRCAKDSDESKDILTARTTSARGQLRMKGRGNDGGREDDEEPAARDNDGQETPAARAKHRCELSATMATPVQADTPAHAETEQDLGQGPHNSGDRETRH